MATPNIKLTLEGLQFPDYDNDNSKKNFRIMFTFYIIDEKGKSGIAYAALPPVTKNNWTWKEGKEKKDTYLPNDGKGLIKVQEIPSTERIVMWEKTNIHAMKVEILDIRDKQFMDYLSVTLKELKNLGLDYVSGGLSGVFLKVFDTAKPEVTQEVDKLIDKLTNKDKLLFKGEFVASGSAYLKEGVMEIVKGKGVLAKKNDGKGEYSIKFELSEIG